MKKKVAAGQSESFLAITLYVYHPNISEIAIPAPINSQSHTLKKMPQRTMNKPISTATK
jgi:hypothetical protein